MTENAKIVLEYFETVSSRESFYGLYYLGEMYRQGFLVDKNPDKAWDYYFRIVYSTNPLRETDEYYWRACYRLGSLYLDTAAELIDTAKRIFDERGYEAIATDITKREIDQKWKLVKKAATEWTG